MPLPNDPSRFAVVDPENAFISVFDRSFHFGDSVYEVVRTYGGVLYGVQEHFDRLRASMKMGMWEELPDFSVLEEMVRAACQQFFRDFGNRDAYVRVTVSRGVSDTNIDPGVSSSPYAVVIAKEMPPWPEWHYTKGVEFWIVDRRRNPNSAMPPAMKSGNYLNNVLAIAEAKKHGASDAILLNVHGFVTEGTTNNIFIALGGEVWTPPPEAGILEGLTRRHVIDLCKRNRIPLQERLFTAEDLLKSEEVFLSSTTRGVVPITKVSGQPIGKGIPGPLSKKLQSLLQNDIQRAARSGVSLFRT